MCRRLRESEPRQERPGYCNKRLRPGWLARHCDCQRLVSSAAFSKQTGRQLRRGRLQNGVAFDDQGRSFAGMGIVFEDYDNDGWPDLFVNALSYQKYASISKQSRLVRICLRPQWSRADLLAPLRLGDDLFDYDNDGWKDCLWARVIPWTRSKDAARA